MQDADFITADFLYMFRASSAHHQENKILTRQPPVQQILLLQTFSTCFGRQEPIIRSIKY